MTVVGVRTGGAECRALSKREEAAAGLQTTAINLVETTVATGNRMSGKQLERWIARELHDGVVQHLTLVLVQLEIMRRERLPRCSGRRLDDLESEVRSGLYAMRDLMRRLRAEPLVDDGIIESITALLADFERGAAIRTRLTVSCDWPSELPAETSLNLRRIIQEALTNVRMHSGARTVDVALTVVDGCPQVVIADDGRGQEEIGYDGARGMGVLGMRERAAILGGALRIDSEPGRGTVVRATLERTRDRMPGDAP